MIFGKFFGAIRAQMNKLANFFWEADPIAQMQYEYDLAAAKLTFWGFPAGPEHNTERFGKGSEGEPAGCAGSLRSFVTHDDVDMRLAVAGLAFLPRFELDAFAQIVKR